MPTDDRTGILDDLPYKLNTQFPKKGVVVHRRDSQSWRRWDLGSKETWKWVKNLGTGGFGVVWLEKEAKTRRLRAVKRVTLLELTSKEINFKRELETLIALRGHQNLFVQFLGWYQDKAQEFLYLAMEYIEHGDLGDYLKKFGAQSERNAREITRQILEGLVVLHSRQICHRDLKPENVLIASTKPIKVKLADFGVSKCTEGTRLDTRLGTIGYQAPELLGLLPRAVRRGNELEYTNAVDIWSLGCLLHKILTLETPFLERECQGTSWDTEISGLASTLLTEGGGDPNALQTDMRLFQEYCSGTIDLPTEHFQPQPSPGVVDFLKRLLVPDPSSRISPADALNHRWTFGWPEVIFQESAAEAMRSQFESLGVKLNFDTMKKVILEHRRQHLDADISTLVTRSSAIRNIADLRVAAASRGYRLILEILLGSHTNEDSKVGSKLDPYRAELQAAAQGGHLEVVQLLLQRGADVNAKPALGNGLTALQGAAEGGHVEVVELLLEKGANVNAEPSWSGRTALQAAAQNRHLEIIILLLEKGADVNAEPALKDGRTALQEAAETGNVEVVKLLLERGADVNVEPARCGGRTALQAAAQGGHLEIVMLLLEKGANVNTGPAFANGRTALQAAAEGGHVEVVKMLLEKGAGANAEPALRGGRSALQAAIEGGHLEVVSLLKSARVNAEPAQSSGRTAPQAATEPGYYKTMSPLGGEVANAEPAWSSSQAAFQTATDKISARLLAHANHTKLKNRLEKLQRQTDFRHWVEGDRSRTKRLNPSEEDGYRDGGNLNNTMPLVPDISIGSTAYNGGLTVPRAAGGLTTAPPSASAFKINPNRIKSKRWVEAKSVDYDSGWGDFEEE